MDPQLNRTKTFLLLLFHLSFLMAVKSMRMNREKNTLGPIRQKNK